MELLAPGGDIDSIKAAIVAGANAIYCGLDRFNARNSATNISFDQLGGILKLAHLNKCQIFLTLNIIILEYEIPALIQLLNKLVNTSIDGIIVQDVGLLYILKKYFKSLPVHGSTQLTTHNNGQISFLKKLGVDRVNLSRELNLAEIKSLTSFAHDNDLKTEVFVHGSYCLGFSGLCYFSSVTDGNSGNRGRCSQPCRDRYQKTLTGNSYPLNLKDNSAFFDLQDLKDARVDSLKIEGRIKKADYVFTTVSSFKKQIAYCCNDNSDLYKVFNRGFTNGYLQGNISKNMFIDNPRSNLGKYSQIDHDEKVKLLAGLIDRFSVAKTPMTIVFFGKIGTSLKVVVTTSDFSFTVESQEVLAYAAKNSLDFISINRRFRSLNNHDFYIEKIELTNLQTDLYISFKELTDLRNRIAFILNGSKNLVQSVELPQLGKSKIRKPSLSILISSVHDIKLKNTTPIDIYFQLPEGLASQLDELVSLFLENDGLIPWFPSIVIGENYLAAVQFLKRVKPSLIVTNNTGIAFAAYEMGIDWIAGPYLNVVNSYSLLALKEEFNCCGSFISNEINKNQIKQIVAPDDFRLCYSIYHPVLLLTSRQCLFFSTLGCSKGSVDNRCVGQCKKRDVMIDMNDNRYIIDKRPGFHSSLYCCHNFLNTDITKDLPDHFSDYFVDLRDIETETKFNIDKSRLIKLFENLLHGDLSVKEEVNPTINNQYFRGL